MSCCDKHLLKKSLSRYKYPELVWKDISAAHRQFTDLYPSEKTFVFNDGTKQNLVQIEGTIPVPYKDNVYNIPVQLWLLDLHPYGPPMVYVRPTSSMNIRASRYVDMNGKVDMPFLQQWKWPDSDLLGLIQVLIVIFGEECPLFSKVIGLQVPTTQPNPRSSYGTLTAPREISMLTEDNTTIMTACEDKRNQKLMRVFSEMKDEMSALKISDTDLSGSNVTQDHLMKDLLHANYKNPDLASRDVARALHHYRDLRPSLQQFYFNDGTEQQLLQLAGTIPVPYKGKSYNIPIQLWILDSHPHNSPMVFVRPTTNMQIKATQFVDKNGKIDVPFLKEWRGPTLDLTKLIQELIVTFEKECPVFSKAVH